LDEHQHRPLPQQTTTSSFGRPILLLSVKGNHSENDQVDDDDHYVNQDHLQEKELEEKDKKFQVAPKQ
jgi:hypothetical protein